MNSQLHLIPVLLYRKDHKCFRILLKIPGQLHYFLLSVSMDIFGEIHFLFTKLKFHMRQLLSFHRSSGVI